MRSSSSTRKAERRRRSSGSRSARAAATTYKLKVGDHFAGAGTRITCGVRPEQRPPSSAACTRAKKTDKTTHEFVINKFFAGALRSSSRHAQGQDALRQEPAGVLARRQALEILRPVSALISAMRRVHRHPRLLSGPGVRTACACRRARGPQPDPPGRPRPPRRHAELLGGGVLPDPARRREGRDRAPARTAALAPAQGARGRAGGAAAARLARRAGRACGSRSRRA